MDAYTLWRQWYAMEDTRPADTESPEFAAWAARCAELYVAAKAAERPATIVQSPFVRRALAGELPAAELSR